MFISILNDLIQRNPIDEVCKFFNCHPKEIFLNTRKKLEEQAVTNLVEFLGS